jgi:hypothetical protein
MIQDIRFVRGRGVREEEEVVVVVVGGRGVY